MKLEYSGTFQSDRQPAGSLHNSFSGKEEVLRAVWSAWVQFKKGSSISHPTVLSSGALCKHLAMCTLCKTLESRQ